MTHASLFSGIGGAELAASWMGWDNIFHCEINPFGRKVIEYWFPKSKSYEDIKKTDFRGWRWKVDILTGGFPCQPFSQAGKRGGDTDDRYLWPEMLRAIREVHPTWVVGENVGGITSMVESGDDVEMGRGTDIFEESIIYRKEQEFTIERICKDFEREGYSVQPVLIPACAVGAPHRRGRVWFIAHCNDTEVESQQGREKLSHESESITDTKSVGSNNNRTKYIIKKNNKKVWPELQRKTYRFSDEQPFAHADSNRWRIGENEQEFIKTDWHDFPTQSPVCCGNDGISDRLDGITFPAWRAESIKAYGNAWVPQVACEIFKAIEKNIKLID